MKIYEVNLENLKVVDIDSKSLGMILEELQSAYYEDTLESFEYLIKESGESLESIDEDLLMESIKGQVRDILDEILSGIDCAKEFKEHNDKAKKMIIDDIIKHTDCIEAEQLSDDEIELVGFNESALTDSQIIFAADDALEIYKEMYGYDIATQLVDIIKSSNAYLRYQSYSLEMPSLSEYNLMAVIDKLSDDIKVVRKY